MHRSKASGIFCQVSLKPERSLSFLCDRPLDQVAHRSDIMASGGTDNIVRIWDIRMGKALQEGIGHSAKVRRNIRRFLRSRLALLAGLTLRLAIATR